MESHILQYVGACLAMVVGLTGLSNPSYMKTLLGLTWVNKVGLIEIRVLFGSFLVVLPAIAMIQGKADVFVFYGFAAVGAAVIKSVFTWIDGCALKDIWVGILVDVILAALLLSSIYA